MFLTPIYIAMTFVRTWRMRSFRARLLEFLGGDTSVAFCRVPENAAETPTLSSKLCTNPKNAHLCDLLDYTSTTRVCSMRPLQCIELRDWVACAGGLPLGAGEPAECGADSLDLDVLLECEMEAGDVGYNANIVAVESLGRPVAWKAGTHLALVVRTDIEHLTLAGFNLVGGDFLVEHYLPVVRIQTVLLTGEPNKATDPSMRSLRSDIQQSLKKPPSQFQWSVHAALLRKLSKVVDIKSESRSTLEMNGTGNNLEPITVSKMNISLTDVSVNTVYTASSDIGTGTDNGVIHDAIDFIKINDDAQDEPVEVIELEIKPEVVVSNQNVTVEIQHNITPKKSSLRLDLKKGASQLSSSLLNISSQIKSVTTHKRIISTTAPKKSLADSGCVKNTEKTSKSGEVEKCPAKAGARASRPLVNTKSVNVLIYSDSVVTRDNLEASLKKVLDCDRYTIYSVSADTLESGAWRGRAALVAVAGDVPGRAAALLLAHLLSGGRLLALCSDLLHTTLPYYKTAEVRENEVVQFSYDKWQSVRMKHHIFCYQASPAKKQFSTESDKQPSKYTGHPGHELDIQILASEETWRTPSLLQATDLGTLGIAIFSQIHLEADPSEYLGAEGAPLDTVRLDMLHKILGDLLGLHTRTQDPDAAAAAPQYSRAYFLGNHVHKMSLVERLCPTRAGAEEGDARVLRAPPLSVQWCMRGEAPARAPARDYLPVMVHECPENFSTVEYFDNLTSEELGRLVIYSDTMSSSQELVCAARLRHGLAVVPREQLAGRGRGDNRWLGADGCAMLSLQVWMKMSAATPLTQHAAALAAVRAVRTLPGHEPLDIRIKWPNDIYYGRDAKIGGVLTNASCEDDQVIVNIGTGVNLSNMLPTTCVNEIIRQHNRAHAASGAGAALPPLSLEKFLARYCSQLERILAYIETDGGVDAFLEQYYAYWLHDGETVQVKQQGCEAPVSGTVVGLDGSGYLRVRTAAGDLTVHPGDNTFDMMTGLIAPRH